MTDADTKKTRELARQLATYLGQETGDDVAAISQRLNEAMQIDTAAVISHVKSIAKAQRGETNIEHVKSTLRRDAKVFCVSGISKRSTITIKRDPAL